MKKKLKDEEKSNDTLITSTSTITLKSFKGNKSKNHNGGRTNNALDHDDPLIYRNNIDIRG